MIADPVGLGILYGPRGLLTNIIDRGIHLAFILAQRSQLLYTMRQSDTNLAPNTDISTVCFQGQSL